MEKVDFYLRGLRMSQSYEVITEDMFGILDKTLSVPTVLFNEKEIVYFNEAYSKMFGYNQEEYTTYFQKKVFAKEDIVNSFVFSEEQNIVKGSYKCVKNEVVMHKKNGEEIYIEYIGKIVLYNCKKYILAQIYDITEKKNIELNLIHLSKVRALMLEITQSVLSMENIHEIFNLILKNALKCIENSELGSIFIKEGDFFKIVAYNGFDKDIEGFTLPLESTTLYKLTDGKMDQTRYMPDISLYEHYYPVHTKFGENKLIKSTMTAPIIIKGELFGMINIDSLEINQFTEDDIKTLEFIRNSVEITISNHMLYEKTRYLAKYDALTDMYNRAYFNEAFDEIKLEYDSKREGFLVAIFDLDGLKRMNDYFGHLVGDKAIIAVADFIKRTARGKDVVARLGGDEFCGIYFNSTKEELKDRFEHSLPQLLINTGEVNKTSIPISFSFGIAQFPIEGNDFSELVKIADERMYCYKKLHRECRQA